MRLFLVRHAETEWNELKRYQGHMDIQLSRRGHEQARMVAARLALEDISAVYSSDLTRARSTAEEIAATHALKVETRRALREVDVGAWEGLSIEEIRERFPEDFERWKKDSANVRFPQGESYLDVKVRAMPVIDEIVRRHRAREEGAVVVSHSGPLKVIICTLLGLDLNERYRFSLANASVSLVTFVDGLPPRLELLNDTCHLLPLAASSCQAGYPPNTRSPKNDGA